MVDVAAVFIHIGPVLNNGFVFLSVVAVVFEGNRLVVDGQLWYFSLDHKKSNVKLQFDSLILRLVGFYFH